MPGTTAELVRAKQWIKVLTKAGFHHRFDKFREGGEEADGAPFSGGVFGHRDDRGSFEESGEAKAVEKVVIHYMQQVGGGWWAIKDGKQESCGDGRRARISPAVSTPQSLLKLADSEWVGKVFLSAQAQRGKQLCMGCTLRGGRVELGVIMYGQEF